MFKKNASIDDSQISLTDEYIGMVNVSRNRKKSFRSPTFGTTNQTRCEFSVNYDTSVTVMESQYHLLIDNT